ncbi:hypothetical protein SADUNF_Sadunf02G0143800 [Salix dunnii]|uniref:Uncharacterized protein n=1 Tax=Salix dunnii TaxID=1413687 RepID=A0A835N7Z7_9ROSI|nr:hypothetical protein SADUNF_Sadunf02G0143800 [Salix dunnii]
MEESFRCPTPGSLGCDVEQNRLDSNFQRSKIAKFPLRSVEWTSRDDNFESPIKDIRRHEHNLKFLKSQANHLDKSILDLQGLESIIPRMQQMKTVTFTLRKNQRSRYYTKSNLQMVKSYHGIRASNLSLIKDALGIVATLARVNNDTLSRLASLSILGVGDYAGNGLQAFDGIKALEKYDGDGKIKGIASLHGLGSSIGRKIDDRFTAICLEDLRHKPTCFLCS